MNRFAQGPNSFIEAGADGITPSAPARLATDVVG